MTSRQYLAWLVTTVVALSFGATALTVLVDPYRMFGTPVVQGWTGLKPRIYQEVGIAKTYQLERIHPRTILLGNSRVEIGFDPSSPRWPANLRPVFNAAEAGRDLFTAFFMLREAIAAGDLNTAIIGVDFQDFLQTSYATSEGLPPIGPDERRLLVDRSGNPNPDRPLQLWQDRITSTLTIDALTDSFQTLFDQNARTTATMTASGFNPLNEYRLYVQRSGYFGLFAHAADEYAHQYSRYMKPDFGEASTIANRHYLKLILGLAKTHRIRVILFTPPYHAEYLEMLHRMGLWPSFRAWQKSLARLGDDANKVGVQITLFDCSTYNSFTNEAVPPANDRTTEMQWYWEPGHYKSTLGDELLQLFFYNKSQLGEALTPDDVAAVLAQTEKRRADYISRDHNAVGLVRSSLRGR